LSAGETSALGAALRRLYDVPATAEYRTLFAVFWLLMLLPDGRAHHRNPPGSLADQAAHVLHLLAARRTMVHTGEKRVRSGHGGS
jgi:Mg-chelatase subunit ChlD